MGSEGISEYEGNDSIDLALGGSSYRVSEYIPPVVMHASSISFYIKGKQPSGRSCWLLY